MQAVIYSIDKGSNDVRKESTEPIDNIEELIEELPDNSPRYVLLSYPIKLSDGRVKSPFVLLYWRPPTTGQENKMLYAGAVELFREKAGVAKLIEIEEEEDFEDIEKKNAPAWFKLSSDEVVEQIIKYARKGLTPSQIGVILRDAHGVSQAKVVTGNKILRILKSNGLAPEIPEDLYFLIKKAVSVRKHLERNRKDKDSKFRLILIESRIHRLARYYRTVAVLPPNWKYESATASALVN
ncbi:40S ribosomal protein S13 [Candidozyma pseudohaemuli]|uniref:40S ribosomal protein S13 n=1 Tax=Candidozyma pseudohaemuli TaxID=418784 RepID=A0A2P7YZG6_9ASCO|nr:40S ribosomal protein S13 [[Candida] pseudohaemulonii]PSK41356.1 40S ribosomal protein S13 [[Candida] pseudohaemulonii]